MELIMKRNRRGNERTLKCYELGSYEVSVITYDSGWQTISITPDREKRYLPEIYARDDLDGNVLGFHIQTTSYGAVKADQIRKVIEGLEEAVQAAEILTKEFVKEEQK